MSGLDIYFLVVSGVFGLFIGSFLNVLVYRIPNGEDFVHGRSHCPKCGHDLSGFDLVPVFSYLALGRRCRYCRAPISGRYALVELLTGGLFALSYWLSLDVSPWLALPLDALIAATVVAVFIRIDGHRAPKSLLFTALGLATVIVVWVAVAW